MWKFVGGKFVFQERVAVPSTISSSQTNLPNTQNHTTADSGTFVDCDGLPANGDVVAGVASGGQIIYTGVVDAYVVDTTPIAHLSGVYRKTINGLDAGQVVLTYDRFQKSFVLASTKSDELAFLRDRLNALTGDS